MNKLEAFARRTATGWNGFFRFSHHAEPYPVLEDGSPKNFDHSMEAENAALRAILAHLNKTTAYRRESKQERAERVFGSIFVNGRSVPVETKGRK